MPTTPHMYAYVVPKDKAGKLNCRAFYGARDALSAMQTDFSEKVGRPHGLERGLEGSRARHTSIREYYGRVQESERQAPSVDVLEPSLADRLNPKAYGERVAKAVVAQLGPDWKRMAAKSSETDRAKGEAKTARAAQEQQQRELKPLLDALRPLRDQERKKLVEMAAGISLKMQDLRSAKLAEKERQKGAELQAPKGQDRGPAR